MSKVSIMRAGGSPGTLPGRGPWRANAMAVHDVSGMRDCYGCGVCAVACGRRAIEIRLNRDGFYEPRIVRPEACSGCGACVEVCSFGKESPSAGEPGGSGVRASYAAWSNDARVRRKCSSGGMGFELGRAAIARGYKVCGVRYDVVASRAEHYVAATVEELVPSIGSKYVQSYTVEGFRSAVGGGKFLVTGTPCQIDSFRRYVRKFRAEEDFLLMDFFCHGVPSMWALRKYLAMAEKTVGAITYVSWRNKRNGWHDSWVMSMDGKEKGGDAVNWHDSYNNVNKGKKSYLNSRWSQGDLFYRLFLGHYCMNPACHAGCKYKYDASGADIRIGDLWGDTYKDNEEGVSAAVAFTSKGDEWLRLTDCTLVEHPFSTVAEGQMRENAGAAALRPAAMRLLRGSTVIGGRAWRLVFLMERVAGLFFRGVRKVRRALGVGR